MVNTIKKIIGKLIRLTYKLVYRFIPSDPNTILFISFHGKGYSDNPAALYEYMRDLDLIKDIKVGHGVNGEIQKAIVADIFEAFMGAIYLDQGFDVAKKVIEALIDKYANDGIKDFDDVKILKLEPFTEFGNPMKIAKEFGGKVKYFEAIKELEQYLYA